MAGPMNETYAPTVIIDMAKSIKKRGRTSRFLSFSDGGNIYTVEPTFSPTVYLTQGSYKYYASAREPTLFLVSNTIARLGVFMDILLPSVRTQGC